MSLLALFQGFVPFFLKHQRENSDPDPHQIKNPHPDPHQG
jgi:hypothetical protein